MIICQWSHENCTLPIITPSTDQRTTTQEHRSTTKIKECCCDH